MAMLKPDACPVCCGSGEYPVFDHEGNMRYTIQCPECMGLGKMITLAQENEIDAEKEIARKDSQDPSEKTP